MSNKLLYDKLPVIFAKKPEMAETETPETETPETETLGRAENLLREVKFYRGQITRNINDFIRRKIPREINNKFSRIFWNAVRDERDLGETLTDLKRLYDSVPPPPPYSEGRAASRVRQISRWLNQLRKRNLRYLDVGCSEASITESIAEALHLREREIYGCDIFIEETPEGKVIFSRSTPTSLPYGDEEFDLVTTFQALHHFTDPEVMLSEIHRVLKPGGVYIIREHDVRNPSFGVYLDVVHAIYAAVMGSEMSPGTFAATYESFYHNKEQWSRDYIIPQNFKFAGLVKTNDRFNSYYARYYKI